MKDELYQFKITLTRSDPLIWRRFRVNSDVTFHQLHGIIQKVMGWKNYHLYAFAFKQHHILMPEMDAHFFEDESKYANEVCLYEWAKRVTQKFLYIYDFGCDWQHEIRFEERIPIEEGIVFPICTEGKMACPPEDSGGVYGYYESLGEKDPDSFNIDEVNNNLRKLEW
ncbi:MAG: plasmid pRiA4b ORF-3 family protein [bacterium]|nr:plasmid pRiA4b ORF-3 family protein [bacterium]